MLRTSFALLALLALTGCFRDEAHRQQVVAALNGMTLSGQQGYSSYNAYAPKHFLKDSWFNLGSNMCLYDNGTVLNVGAAICPMNI